jgi:hypothetical protein
MSFKLALILLKAEKGNKEGVEIGQDMISYEALTLWIWKDARI